MRRDQLLVVLGQQKRLRHDVKVLVAAQVLHTLDVLVQAVLARQLVGSVEGEERNRGISDSELTGFFFKYC